MNKVLIKLIGSLYRNVVKPIFFKIDPQRVHDSLSYFANIAYKFNLIRRSSKSIFNFNDKLLRQEINGINFENPIGLAAGFDYECKLIQALPNLNFGFHTLGTITNLPYNGNPKPMLGRLPKSKSLMVNKGFKNFGADKTIEILSAYESFDIPVGVSIGRTNRSDLNQAESVKDIISAFIKFIKSSIPFSYYELNISCPNLFGNVSFYDSEKLNDLLNEIDMLGIQKPIYVKMPIDKTDEDVLKMLDVISSHKIKGVIFGNLQKKRDHEDLIPAEVEKFDRGNFSGKPTFSRSNELIKLSYKNYGSRLIIIGCGGVFSASDAYTKIKSGASLIQLITGLIFEGPQLITEINLGLIDLLRRDGFKNISEAVGQDT